jgi:hypothetical protein
MKSSIFMLALALLMTGCAKKTADLQCPLPKSGAATGSLRETPTQIASTAEELATGSTNEINIVIAALRKRHPGASQAEVVNYLVTAYCPKIKSNPALDRSQKQKAMMSFSRRVYQIAGA